MAAEIHVLHPTSQNIGAFLRVGHTGHKKLESLAAAGRLRFNRVVFDAAHIADQADLLATLKASGCEIVLDPNVAETAAEGRYQSAVKNLPWGNSERPWTREDFTRARNFDLAHSIAEFAVSFGVDAVLSPSHLEDAHSQAWRKTDCDLIEALRQELDKAGGKSIAIDCQVITVAPLFKDASYQNGLVSDFNGLPFDNMWLRVAGFGSSATGVAAKKFIDAARGLHPLNRPVIADMAGGLFALSAAAFGAIGGFGHGVGIRENFRANDWRRLPAKSSGGGSAARIYVPELDRSFTDDQLSAMFKVRGGKARLCCNNTACCSHSADMIDQHEAHFLAQRSSQIDDLSKTPELRRPDRFLLHHLQPAVKTSRFAAELKVEDESLRKILSDAKKRLVGMQDVLSALHDTGVGATRSRHPNFRGGRGSVSMLMGKA